MSQTISHTIKFVTNNCVVKSVTRQFYVANVYWEKLKDKSNVGDLNILLLVKGEKAPPNETMLNIYISFKARDIYFERNTNTYICMQIS